MTSISTITNKDKKDLGFWIRPDDQLSGINYDKLILQNEHVDGSWNWQSENKMFGYRDLSANSYVLNYKKDIHQWTAQSSDYVANNMSQQIDGDFDKSEFMDWDRSGIAFRKFMPEQIHSMLEEDELYDISWERLHDIDDLAFENYNGDDIVWRVQKHWIADGNYSMADTIEKTLWLSDFEELSDGTQKWTLTQTSCYEDQEQCIIRYVDYIAGTITRQAKSYKPYQTIKWTASIPQMFDFPSVIAARHNSKQICLSYINNNPLTIKYVIADAIPRKIFDMIFMKQRDWNVYQQYIKGNETVLYDDTLPFLFD